MLLLRRPLALVAGLGLLATLAVPADAVEGAAPIRPGGFRFEAAPGTVMTVPGLGRFVDTIEVLPTPDGRLQVVNELTLDAYVEGLGEMPASWPMEALKAQAVAARTYAWYVERRGYYLDQGLDFDICASTACQVFHGRGIIETPGVGRRWAQAVADTAGEVLTHEDRPILARFFSSSGGRTRNNEDVFPSSGPRPYLQEVEDPHDAEASPLARWRVRFRRDELEAILARGERLSAAVPLRDIEWVASDGSGTDQIRLTREDGHVVEIDASVFRGWVSDLAPAMFPTRFPQRRADGGPMPATLPSSRLRFHVRPQSIVVDGYGWGHGVGMSQYGAKGKAAAGMAHDEILSTYYRDSERSVHADAPGRVRVGLTWDAREVSVRADGPMRVLTPTVEADAPAGATWSLRAAGATRVERSAAPRVEWQPRTSETRRLPRAPEPVEEPAMRSAAVGGVGGAQVPGTPLDTMEAVVRGVLDVATPGLGGLFTAIAAALEGFAGEGS